MRDLWVNISPYFPVELPNSIVIWDQVSENFQFPQTDQDISRYGPLKQYVLGFLKDIKLLNIINTEGMVTFLLNILMLNITFVDLGFYTMVEVNDLIVSLRDLLFRKLKLEKRAEKVEFEVLQEIIECKKIIGNTFQKLILFIADIRSQIFCHRFKELFISSSKSPALQK